MRKQELNLTNCDKEPIHVIGAVQAHGYFLAFKLSDKTVYHASTNVYPWLKKKSAEVLNERLDKVFPEATAAKILAAAANLKGQEFEILRLAEDGGGVYEVLVYALDGLIALEFEKQSDNIEETSALAQSQKRSLSFIEDLHVSRSLESAAKSVCRAIRGMIGFERVMMYRYLPSWDGEVIAEDKSPESHSFLHHRFPATDIPLPARELYLKNRTRQISDSRATSVVIEPGLHYLTRKPLDLSHSKLRAVSPIHLEYLKNMNVTASFSVAVIVDQQLWGLIACHGTEAKVIPHELRLSCETLASTFAVLANMMESLAHRSENLVFEEKLRKLFQSVRLSSSPVSQLLQNHAAIEEIFSAAGIGLANTREVEIAGLTPPQQYTKEIADWLRGRFNQEHKTVLAVESLGEVNKDWAGLKDLACGVLAVFSPENDQSVFMIFRPELLRSVTWGGDPRKTMEKRQYQGPINPRVSFESWTETVSGHSRRWTNYEVQGAAYLRDFVFDSLVRKERLIQELGSQLKLGPEKRH